MKILRIIISLVIIGVAVFLAVEDFKKREFLTYTITQEIKGDQPVEQWRLKQEFQTWLTKHLQALSLDHELKDEVYTILGEASHREPLDALVNEWNGVWEKELELSNTRLEEQKKEHTQTIADIKAELSKIETLLSLSQARAIQSPEKQELKLQDIKELNNKVKQTVKKNAPAIVKEKKRNQPTEAVKKDVVETLELTSGGNQQDVDLTMKEISRIQGSISDLHNTIKDERLSFEKNQSKNQEKIEGLIAQLDQTVRKTQLSSDTEQSKALFAYVKSIDQRIQKQFGQLSQTIEKRDAMHQQNFDLGKDQMKVYLEHQKAKLSQAINKLEAKEYKTAETTHIALSLADEKSEARVQGLFGSYRLFVFALIACFIFNYIWEVVSQRSKV